MAEMAETVEQNSSESSLAGSKRKSEEGNTPGQARAKRNRYISIACNECKRRKIKCNGQVPCQRCGNLDLECVYAPNCCAASFKESDEFKKMMHQISALQAQVETLFATMDSLRSEMTASQPQIDPALQRHPINLRRSSIAVPPQSPGMLPQSTNHSKQPPPTFRGPMSSEFNLGVAKHSLRALGITPHDDACNGFDPPTADVTPIGTPPSQDAPLHPTKDPIWHISREEALRLVKVYEDEMHEMYPAVSIPHIVAHVNNLYTYMEAASRNGLVHRAMPGADSIDDDDTNILKLVLATAMMVEGSGKSELGRRMYKNVQPAAAALLSGHAGYKGIQLLALTAMYEFHCDNEARSWRVIGLTVRLCIELGLHRKETYDALPEDDRNPVILLFWAIYCLDRRWSFGTGMPFALQDSDIDLDLPKPDENSPYLSAMIAHFAIASKVWHAMGTDASKHNIISKQEVGYLDYQVINWHRSLPPHLRYENPAPSNNKPKPHLTQGQHRLQIILYLRANSMRILIHRPVLHSATSIMNNRTQAQTVIDVAKDTIRVLTQINQTTKMYCTSQVLFNAFLTSALAVIFLAVSHAPAAFAEQVREEFYLALDLVRGFSRGSWVSKRLWKTIRVLKEVGPKLGLVMRTNHSSAPNAPNEYNGIAASAPAGSGFLQSETSARTQHDQSHHRNHSAQPHHLDDPSHSAAVAMAGLAGHNVDENTIFGPGLSTASTTTPGGPSWAAFTSASAASNSPDGMVSDLTSLFDSATAGVYGGFGSNGEGANRQADGNGNGVFPFGAQVTETTPGGGQYADLGGFGSEDELSRIMRDLF